MRRVNARKLVSSERKMQENIELSPARWCYAAKPYMMIVEQCLNTSREAAEAMPRVYFDNLANAVTRDDVEEYFSRAGKVRGVLVVTDKASGKSRGFGCVDMEKLDDALHAIKWLNHADLKGKRIRIHPGPLREQN
jgi:RNA recognition motif. (a.k.a. RRM, RBD, or RNP domain)